MAAEFDAIQYVEVVYEGYKVILSKPTALKPTTKKLLKDKIKKLDKSQREKISRMIDKL